MHTGSAWWREMPTGLLQKQHLYMATVIGENPRMPVVWVGPPALEVT